MKTITKEELKNRKKLEDLGFKNVYDFEGGKKAWREAGYPME